MRLVIKQIMETLDCSDDFAKKVEYQMECAGFDFSESTDAEFKQEVNYAVFELNLS